MSKSIKVSEDVYTKLEEFRLKRESFSEAIRRLLSVIGPMLELTNILEGSAAYAKWQAEKLREKKPTE